MKIVDLNALLHARIRDLADRKPPRTLDEARERAQSDLQQVRRALGVAPELPRTALNAHTLKDTGFDGYRLRLLSFESRPGLPALAHLYLPEGPGPFPAVVQGHQPWPHQSAEPWVQARGIGLALSGIAALIVTPPGDFESAATPARRGLGSPASAWTVAGAPFLGIYAWDLIRAADLAVEQPEIRASRLGVAGDGVASWAAMCAYALEPRFEACAALFQLDSWQHVVPARAIWETLPGIGAIGDVSELLSLRPESPLMLAGAQGEDGKPTPAFHDTVDVVERVYRLHRSESKLRLETFPGEPDVHRRTREAMAAFFAEHLAGRPFMRYLPEARPLTDGRLNPAPSGTLPSDSDAFHAEMPSGEWTFERAARQALEAPYPSDDKAQDRLAPWGRYGRLEMPKFGNVIRLQDDTAGQAAPDTLVLPTSGVDTASLVHLGLSLGEFYGQLLHLSAPGGPEGWESVALGGDPLTSMIAGVKSLIGRADEQVPTHVEARGPVSSVAARALRRLREGIQVTASHGWASWIEMLEANDPNLAEPQARYRTFPYAD